MLFAALMAACGSTGPAGVGGPVFGGIGGLSGGYTTMGGRVAFEQALDPQFDYLY